MVFILRTSVFPVHVKNVTLQVWVCVFGAVALSALVVWRTSHETLSSLVPVLIVMFATLLNQSKQVAICESLIFAAI